MQRLPWLALALAAAAALVSGCGSSSTASSQTSSTPAVTSSTSTTGSTSAAPPTASSTATTKTSAPATGGAISQLAVRACKSRVQAEPALTSSSREAIERLCSKAAGGTAAAQAVAREVCTEIVKRSAQPGSPMTPAREQALAACKTAK